MSLEAPGYLDSISESLSDYCASCVGFEHRAVALLDELEHLRDELRREAKRVEQQREETEQQDLRRISELQERLQEVQKERDFLRIQLEESQSGLSELSLELGEMRRTLEDHALSESTAMQALRNTTAVDMTQHFGSLGDD